jgi:DNA primase
VIPQPFIQDLLARADIVEIVGRHVQLKKAGINHKGLCPFHGEKTASFIVSPTRQTYHCFGCGVHGNAIGFLMEHTGAGFLDAVRDLAQQLGMNVPDDDRTDEQRDQAARLRAKQTTLTEALARAADHYRKQLKTSSRAIDYLKGRGLSGEIAARFGLGYAQPGWRSLAGVFPQYDDEVLEESGLVIAQSDDDGNAKRYDRFRDRIMFPIRSVQGEVIGFGGRVLDGGEPKYLNSPETAVFVKGRELYGLHEARTALRAKGYALVVEGYMDVVALAQHGFPNTVATLGTACTEDHVRKLFRFSESVVFSFDGDAAGRRAASRAMEASLPHASDTRTIRFLFLPPEHDPDSFIRDRGGDAFEAAVQQAVPLSRQLLETARESCDLATAEGRARLLAQAKPLWSALPEGALRRQMLSEFAGAAQLSAAELSQLWGGAAFPAPEARPPAPSQPRRTSRGPALAQRPIRQPADNAAWVLAAHSQAWERLSAADHELLCALPGWHGEFFRWLDRHVHEQGFGPWAALQAASAGESWNDPVGVLMAGDVELQPTEEELPGIVEQVRVSSTRPEHERVKAQVMGRL